MGEIHGKGEGSITPREKKLYEQEYVHGAKLFQKALEQHAQSDNMFQQGEFRNVMDKAMNVLNETARELKNKSLAEQNDKISKDYEAFIKQPANEKAWDILHEDLEKAKKLL